MKLGELPHRAPLWVWKYHASRTLSSLLIAPLSRWSPLTRALQRGREVILPCARERGRTGREVYSNPSSSGVVITKTGTTGDYCYKHNMTVKGAPSTHDCCRIWPCRPSAGTQQSSADFGAPTFALSR